MPVSSLMLLIILLPCLSSTFSLPPDSNISGHKFVIEDDQFLKNDQPFRIIGGDLHYFRVHPQLWADRLLRAKALGLNTIQTYVPWNLHEPRPGQLNFNGSADLLAFLRLAHELDFLVMLRVGPYICGELCMHFISTVSTGLSFPSMFSLFPLINKWDLGGFPAWLLELHPPVRLRSSDAQYLSMVDRWWNILLPLIAPSIFSAGGPVIMVQIENEYGSYGSDKVYLQHLLEQARTYLGSNVIIYTTDGATRETLSDGTISERGVYAAIDFPTGWDPASAFALQRQYNPPGMSPLLASEFYTGWLTHWGELLAQTDAASTALALDNVLHLNASVVLYMVHGGTNFGFYNGANTGSRASDFQPDITSYDYDAPIGEAGDVSSAKFQAIRKVLSKYVVGALPEPPPVIQRMAYGAVTMSIMGSLFDMLKLVTQPPEGIRMEWPVPMEELQQASGFILYRSTLPANVQPGSKLALLQVYDRAQIFVGSTAADRLFVGKLERWSHNSLVLSAAAALPGSQLDILVENMGRVNYGLFMGEKKISIWSIWQELSSCDDHNNRNIHPVTIQITCEGITEAVLLDNEPILGWTTYSMELSQVKELKSNLIKKKTTSFDSSVEMVLSEPNLVPRVHPLVDLVSGPVFYDGTLSIAKPSDTFMSLRGWTKGVAFVNGFNLGRFWPSMGPQCTLYIPAPILHSGDNELIILELESSSSIQTVQFEEKADFTCGSSL